MLHALQIRRDCRCDDCSDHISESMGCGDDQTQLDGLRRPGAELVVYGTVGRSHASNLMSAASAITS